VRLSDLPSAVTVEEQNVSRHGPCVCSQSIASCSYVRISASLLTAIVLARARPVMANFKFQCEKQDQPLHIQTCKFIVVETA
jgi:hypothetical protein